MWDNPRFWGGDDALNDLEESLCASYVKLGRQDLADCVRGARVHQRLRVTIGDVDLVTRDPGYMLACIRPLLAKLHVRYRSDFPTTMYEWRAQLLEKFKDDCDLPRVLALEPQGKDYRKPSWIYRALPQRCWKAVWSLLGDK
jgi:hypothetical protein